jgi:hypothetical protein
VVFREVIVASLLITATKIHASMVVYVNPIQKHAGFHVLVKVVIKVCDVNQLSIHVYQIHVKIQAIVHDK